jgi:capsule polysaccharide export protein KpsE/RkpR
MIAVFFKKEIRNEKENFITYTKKEIEKNTDNYSCIYILEIFSNR